MYAPTTTLSRCTTQLPQCQLPALLIGYYSTHEELYLRLLMMAGRGDPNESSINFCHSFSAGLLPSGPEAWVVVVVVSAPRDRP